MVRLSRKKLLAGCIVLVLGGGMAFLPGVARPAPRIAVGDTLSGDLRNRFFALGARSATPLVVMYADSSCAHCVAELARWESDAGRRMEVLSGADLLLVAPQGIGFLRGLVPSFSLVAVDDKDRVFRDGLGVRATPTLLFFDGSGVLRGGLVGQSPDSIFHEALSGFMDLWATQHPSRTDK